MTSAKKRLSSSSGSVPELADEEVDEDGVGGLFAQGQHKIFGTAHAGGPGGVGSGRGEGGILSWRRDLGVRDERAGTKRKPSS